MARSVSNLPKKLPVPESRVRRARSYRGRYPVRSWADLGSAMRFDLLLDMVHHGHRGDKDKRCNHLVQVKTRAKKAPCDAHGSKRLHHFEIAGCRCACKTQPLKINQERDAAGNRCKEDQPDDRLCAVRLRGYRPQRPAMEFAIGEKDKRHAGKSDD